MKHPMYILLFLQMLMTPVLAAEPGAIGFVDMQVLLDESKMGRQARDALAEKFAGRQEELAKEESSIRQFQQTLARDQALMSQDELDKKTAEIKERIQAFERKAARAQRDLVQEQTKLGNAILEPARKIIAVIAKDKKIGAVFERRQSGLLFIDEGLDLTPELIKRLDAQKQ